MSNNDKTWLTVPYFTNSLNSFSTLFLLVFITCLNSITTVTATERISFKEATFGSLPNLVGQVFKMPSDGKAVSYTITDCAAQNQFSDDSNSLYADDKARTDTLTICPQNKWQTVKVVFEDFDISTTDLLSVYDGDLAALRAGNAPLIGSANGYSPSSAFGAWVQASCDLNVNNTGCLTFRFKTNGDLNKGLGWDAWVTCEEKDIELTVPNIASRVWCGEYFDVLTIGGANVKSNCGTAVNDEVLVEVFSSNSQPCINTTLSKSQGTTITQTFAIGVYTIKYTLKSDPTKTVSSVFSVGDPALACNDRVHISMGAACGVQLQPDMITENHCDPIPGIMYYEIVVKNSQGNIIASGGKNGAYPYLSRDIVDFCSEEVYTAEISRIYFEDFRPSYCNAGVQRSVCHTELIFEDKTPPSFQSYTAKDIVYNCNIELTAEGLKKFKPAIIDNCAFNSAVFQSATELSANSNCDRTYLITWKAEDACGNISYLERHLEVRRPGLDKIIKVPDAFLSCGEDVPEDIYNIEKTGIVGLQVGYDKNGTFIITDTINLSTENTVCDYVLTKTDQSYPSECGLKTFREYRLLDWCNSANGTQVIQTQLIKFVDTEAPQIQCTSYSTIETAQQIALPGHQCSTTPNFPTPYATDKCDPNVNVAIFVVEKQNYDSWIHLGSDLSYSGELDCGTYRIGWRAFDKCREQIKEDTCYQYFILEDKTAPSAVCKDQLNVSIGSDYARIEATDVDGGSSDACGIEHRLVRRTICGDMDTWAGEENPYVKSTIGYHLDPIGWAEEVPIECCDLYQTVKLELLVIDKKGNFNICTVDIKPEDKISPTCSSMPSQVAFCDDLHTADLGTSTDTNNNGEFDYDEWMLLDGDLLTHYNTSFGDPILSCTDNLACNALTVEQQYQLIDLNCGQLVVKRRYRAVDWKGNGSNWGEQSITINYRANWSVTFPTDWIGYCGSEVPDSDIQIDKGSCDKLAYEVKDQIFQTGANACYKVIRTFTILNWCNYDPDSPLQEVDRILSTNGMVTNEQTITSQNWSNYSHFTYTQILEVRDTEEPVVSLGEVEECIIGADCTSNKTFTASAIDCNEAAMQSLNFHWEIFEDNYAIGSGTGNSFEWTVEARIPYTVKWSVSDQCGNGAWEEASYTFKDCKAPTPYCLDGIAIALMDNATVDIWGSDFDLGSSDNCSSQSNLDIRLHHESVGEHPSNLEGVLELTNSVDFTCAYVGTQLVSMYVIDEDGNYDYCTASIIIQDNQTVCDYGQVAGKIYMTDGETVDQTEVYIEGIGNMPTPYMTNNNGSYDFVLDMGGTYTIRPQKNINPLNGVSTLDLVYINKHILGIDELASPYKWIAADINKSNTITAFDMVLLRQLILGVRADIPNPNSSWRFIPADYTFLTGDPLSEPFPEYIVINNLPGAMDNLDFVAIKVGDVSGNASSTSLQAADPRSTIDPFTLSIPNQKVQKGEVFTVPIYPENIEGIEGYQFTLAFDHLEFIALQEGIAKTNHFGINHTDRGYITTSWNSFHPTSSTLTKYEEEESLFQLTFRAKQSGTLKEFLSINSAITHAEAYHKNGKLLDVALQTISNNFQLHQNQPNPFKEETAIHFSLPEASTVQLTILTMQGKEVATQQANFGKGNHTLYHKQFLPEGTYFYQLSTAFGTQAKKMIVLK